MNSRIDNVERKDGKVFVTVNGEVEEYDKIIVTAPLFIPNKRTDGQIGMVDYFDAREDEKELFSKIDYERYDVLAVETKPEDHPEISYYVFENMTKETLGHLMVYYRRWKDTKDTVTGSMERAIAETERRRKKQQAYNVKNGIVPRSVEKKVYDMLVITKHEDEKIDEMDEQQKRREIALLTEQMLEASRELEFETAAKLRDRIRKLKGENVKQTSGKELRPGQIGAHRRAKERTHK